MQEVSFSVFSFFKIFVVLVAKSIAVFPFLSFAWLSEHKLCTCLALRTLLPRSSHTHINTDTSTTAQVFRRYVWGRWEWNDRVARAWGTLSQGRVYWCGERGRYWGPSPCWSCGGQCASEGRAALLHTASREASFRILVPAFLDSGDQTGHALEDEQRWD